MYSTTHEIKEKPDKQREGSEASTLPVYDSPDHHFKLQHTARI